MGFFSAFKTSHIKAYAADLAGRLVKLYPPEIERDANKRVSHLRVSRYLEEVAGSAQRLHSERPLSWFQKAVFVNEFNWALRDAGYSKPFIDVATEAVLAYVTRRQADGARG